MTTTGYTPEQARQDAVQANLAMSKSLKADNQRLADYYEGAADTYAMFYARLAGIPPVQASDDIAADLEALEA